MNRRLGKGTKPNARMDFALLTHPKSNSVQVLAILLVSTVN
jgi:hypothetical protein